MPRIRILPDILANKIAAGEVVARPASVVKELVENALDANSTRIRVEIEKGGRSLIRVADNGVGMGRDDALLALERFATSKIQDDGDLFNIQTLGFRGEALPSIAAVSKMTLITRPADAQSGVEIQVDGGKIMRVTDAGAPPGTMISVARLFYNTPARRKFLKTVNTEMGHIGDIVNGMALGWPQVHFKLVHNAKTVKQWPRASDPSKRAADVLGQVTAGELIALDTSHGNINVRGYLGPSRLARSTSRGIYLFVNGRRVRDRTIQHALFEGFHGRLMKGQFPLAVLFLQLPFDQVDVNVHPTKHEIRFADQRLVHDTIRDRVAEALAQAEQRQWATAMPRDIEPPPSVAETQPDYSPKTVADSGSGVPVPGRFDWRPKSSETAKVAVPEDRSDSPSISASQPERHAGARQQPLWEAGGFKDLAIIGQFRGTYIICQAADTLILIDQHAAHERIVYEQLKQRSGRIESQRLLMPETVELGFAEAPILEKLIPELNALGLEVEPFGGTTFVIKAVPAILEDRDMARIIVELAEKAAEIGLGAGLEKVMDECRMVMACHKAIRANQRLTDEQIRHMLNQLECCENPSHCPHGRPTWIRWTLKELEKAFGRIAG